MRRLLLVALAAATASAAAASSSSSAINEAVAKDLDVRDLARRDLKRKRAKVRQDINAKTKDTDEGDAAQGPPDRMGKTLDRVKEKNSLVAAGVELRSFSVEDIMQMNDGEMTKREEV